MKKTEKLYSIKEASYGRTFKILRLSKGFSQLEATNHEMSISQLSNFENGKTVPLTTTFFNLLKNINVDMVEFQNAYNDYLNSEAILPYSTEVSEAYTSGNILKLKDMLYKLETSKKKENKKFKLDKIRLKSIISTLDSNYNNISKKEVEFVKLYLQHLKEWGQYEIKLFGQCVPIFDIPTLSLLGEKMINPTQKNINLHYTKQMIIKAVLNLIDIFTKSKNFDYANKFINYLENTKIHDYFTYEKITIVYSKARLAYLEGNNEALDTIKKCQDLLLFCDCSEIANMIEKEISEDIQSFKTTQK